MREICSLRRLSGGRYLVTLEDGFRFPLYAKELEPFGIAEGGSLAEPDFERVMREILPKRAALSAMHYLQSADRTEQQVRRKLEELFYPQEIADGAVDYVKRYHYLDDLRYAQNYLDCWKDSRSLRQMEQELLRRGIARETFEEAVQQMELPDEESQILRWLEKKHYSGDGAEPKETERMYRFLLRRGYSIHAVQRALRVSE